MKEKRIEFRVVVAVDTTYLHESFWSSITRDYLPFLEKSFAEMDADVSLQFVCLTQARQGTVKEINASPWFAGKNEDLRRFADSLQGRSREFDITEIFRHVGNEVEVQPVHGLVVFAATQNQHSKARAFEHDTKSLALHLKKQRIPAFIFDNADEYNLVSSPISDRFAKASMWAVGFHVSFHSDNLRTLYEYMKIIGPVVADDMVALKKQSGDLITVHGNQLFRKCMLKLSAGKPA